MQDRYFNPNIRTEGFEDHSSLDNRQSDMNKFNKSND
jgi:hypothetical protein